MPTIIDRTQYGLGNLNKDIADMRVRLGALPVGVSGGGNVPNKILLYPANGNPVVIYEPTQSDLLAAIAAQVDGDRIILPPVPILMGVSAGTLVAGGSIEGADWNSVIYFSGFSGTALTLSERSICKGLAIYFDGTGNNDAICLDQQVLGSVIDNCFIWAYGATNNNVGIKTGA